ncbi:hypothetical protein Hanom_Chr14g01267281 [Helianthus anomalus]
MIGYSSSVCLTFLEVGWFDIFIEHQNIVCVMLELMYFQYFFFIGLTIWVE